MELLENYYDSENLTKLLSISYRSLWDWIHTGKVPEPDLIFKRNRLWKKDNPKIIELLKDKE